MKKINKKHVFVLPIIVVTIILSYLLIQKISKDDNTYIVLNDEILNENIKYGEYKYFLERAINGIPAYVPEEGFVPDAKTARKIAEAILKPIYGKILKKCRPLSVYYYEEKGIWLVETGPKQPLFGMIKGGGINVLIQKSDGKILAQWSSK